MTMTETPVDLIGTPGLSSDQHDLLADVLSQIRLSGAIFLRGEYSAPFSLRSPPSSDLVALLAPDTERIIPFHLARRGDAWISVDGHSYELSHGNVAILPHAHQHNLGAGPVDADATQIAALLPPLPWASMPVLNLGGGGERTEIACGYFRCDELLFNTVLRHLPPVLIVRPENVAASFFCATMDYAMQGAAMPTPEAPITARLAELLLAEALRLYAEAAPDGHGWLSATLDPVIARSLTLMHADPAHEWSVEELAHRAGTSRSVLGDRFRNLLGQSPMQYLIEWRMQISAGLLRSTTLKLADIAERVGYSSDAAFSRAFHRHVGIWPAQWREGERAQPPSPDSDAVEV